MRKVKKQPRTRVYLSDLLRRNILNLGGWETRHDTDGWKVILWDKQGHVTQINLATEAKLIEDMKETL